MSIRNKRRYEHDSEEQPPIKRQASTPASFNVEDGNPSSSMMLSSPSFQSSYSNFYVENNSLSGNDNSARNLLDESLSDNSDADHSQRQRSLSNNTGSPIASPNSVYSTSSFDNMNSASLLESHRPTYSHSSSHKSLDYNQVDNEEDDDNVRPGFTSGNSLAFSNQDRSYTEDNSNTNGRTTRTDSSSSISQPEDTITENTKYSSVAQKMMVSKYLYITRSQSINKLFCLSVLFGF